MKGSKALKIAAREVTEQLRECERWLENDVAEDQKIMVRSQIIGIRGALRVIDHLCRACRTLEGKENQ